MNDSSAGFCSRDETFMHGALEEARLAAEAGEVPVGAVIAWNGNVIAKGHNQREKRQSPAAHAEMLAIQEAAVFLNTWRLLDCDLYVTLEPCVMCVGAMLQARIRSLVFGCLDPKAGAVESLYHLANDSRMNHVLAVTGGVLAPDCAGLLQNFFTKLRERKKQARIAERWPSPVEGA